MFERLRHGPSQDDLDRVRQGSIDPMDRGYRDYSRLIRDLARDAGCGHRVLYIHDQHTPTLIRHCRGVVVINSTVGLTAVGMKCPTKPVGEAVWDMEGMTYQGPLEQFWTEADSAVPDHHLYLKFRDELIATTQINGSFYRKLAPEASATGLIWNAEAGATANQSQSCDGAKPKLTLVPTAAPPSGAVTGSSSEAPREPIPATARI
ncbi:hypothetical protein OLX02_13440 [Novosphingobium sp. KCTC 2891]|uniref:capsular polysaccharide export protein, LipB/KpsS family n=1 Tax=Novosphingobium sp. KCTC 2891 TaxID=2989730 RepID=UPI0022215883|nr:hypothetical protein [Novosphingobium sp. KCTC 2891]MCW1383824.1 hypothetical protein [Novosphingobium sp. KCTC 2891]